MLFFLVSVCRVGESESRSVLALAFLLCGFDVALSRRYFCEVCWPKVRRGLVLFFLVSVCRAGESWMFYWVFVMWLAICSVGVGLAGLSPYLPCRLLDLLRLPLRM